MSSLFKKFTSLDSQTIETNKNDKEKVKDLETTASSSSSSPLQSTQSLNSKSTDKLILIPTNSCKIPPPEEFNQQQKTILQEIQSNLLEHHKELETLDPNYIPFEKKWIQDPSTAKRYAKSVNWDLISAKKRSIDTLNWRREYKPDLISPNDVKKEGETGKHILSGFDNFGRPCLYLRPGRENTKPSPNQIKFLIFDLERAIDLCPKNQDKICWLIDYTKANHSTQPNFQTQLKVLKILQNHYPERLGLSIVVNVPWILSSFFITISPFLDPITKSKIKILTSNETVKNFIPIEMLDYEFGGNWKYNFNFTSYWKQLLDFCGISENDGTRLYEPGSRYQLDSNEEEGEGKGEEQERQEGEPQEEK